VSAEKLVVVPQGIDAAYFDPARYEPLVLRAMLLLLCPQADVCSSRRVTRDAVCGASTHQCCIHAYAYCTAHAYPVCVGQP
jgi:hypothetical protein